jgi:lipid A ethanolaminephosphotransferase
MKLLSRLQARWPLAPVSAELLVLAVMLALLLLGNQTFWHSALAQRSWAEGATWRFVLCTGVMLTIALALPVLLLGQRLLLRPLLGLFIVCTVVGAHMMTLYGVVLDSAMLRNALRTDVREASELLSLRLLAEIALALLASAALWAIPLRQRHWRQALLVRAASVLGLTALMLVALLLNFQDFGSLMRNHKTLRFTITPLNIFYATSQVLIGDAQAAARKPEPLQPVSRTARAPGHKPALFVFVLGETARAANFGLGGYARNTTPELAQQAEVIYFSQASSCGTSTEVSVPCMFSPFGRADYDEKRIRASESALELMQRAGVRVVWLDNQSGCKGVCDGTEVHDLSHASDPTLCNDERCFDEILLKGLRQALAEPGSAGRDTVVVMHQLGNHGPAYFRRYPEAFRRFTPECSRNELRECSQAEIVNAYDNAVLYTDHVVSQTIDFLRGLRAQREVGLLYMSDHGESLGEGGLYLHGMPQAIAPEVQKHVPMLWWFGHDGVPEARADLGLNLSCLRARAQEPASHDNLFHSLLGLMQVSTPGYKPERDLLRHCR